VEATPTQTGELVVKGTNAREIVQQIAPDAPVMPGKDGSVIVSARFAGAVNQGIQQIKALEQTPVALNIPNLTRQGVQNATQPEQVAQEATATNGQEAGAEQAAAPAGEVTQPVPTRQGLEQALNAQVSEAATQPVMTDAQVADEYKAIEQRRLSEEIKITAQNGKPFKQRAAVESLIAEKGLSETHEPVQVDQGWIAKRRTPAQLQERQDAAKGIDPYEVVQARAVQELGMQEGYDNDTLTDPQWSQIEARVADIQRQQRGIPPAVQQRVATKTDAELKLMAKANPDPVVQQAVQQEQAIRATPPTKKPRQPKPLAEQDKPLQARAVSFAEDLQAMAQDAGWAETGGRLLRDADGKPNGRTVWIPRAEWFRSGMEGDSAKLAQHVADFLAGNAIPAKSRRTIEGMLEWRESQENAAEVSPDASMYDLERAGYAGVESAQQEAFDAFDEAAGTVLTEAEAMRALGFTEDEINASINGREGQGSRQDQGKDGGTDAKAAGRGEADGARRDEAQVRQEGQAEGLTLESYTNEEIIAREEAARKQEEQKRQDEDRAEQAAKDKETKAEVKKRSEAAASTFELGQDAMDNLNGQGGLFDGVDQNPIKNANPEKPRLRKHRLH